MGETPLTESRESCSSWDGGLAELPRSDGLQLFGKVNAGAHNLRGLPNSCQPGSAEGDCDVSRLHHRVLLHLDRCLPLQTRPQIWIFRKENGGCFADEFYRKGQTAIYDL